MSANAFKSLLLILLKFLTSFFLLSSDALFVQSLFFLNLGTSSIVIPDAFLTSLFLQSYGLLAFELGLL